RSTDPPLSFFKGRAELWDCLYLTRPELDELLEFVKRRAAHPWLYPPFCFLGHTGCRRSEALRVPVTDVDFVGGTALIREKKRSRKPRTTRRVPLTPFLAGVLKGWRASRGVDQRLIDGWVGHQTEEQRKRYRHLLP